MLASQNAAIKSSSFFDKREVYAASPYVLTSQIGSLEEWSAAAIEDRQTKLSLLAIKAWPIS
jgi:hypothetical protein